MTPEEFKQWGYRFVDWTSDYLAHPERYAVLSAARPGDIRKQLPSAPPQSPESFERMLQDLDRVIVPGLTHWNHPSFMAILSGVALRSTMTPNHGSIISCDVISPHCAGNSGEGFMGLFAELSWCAVTIIFVFLGTLMGFSTS